MLARREYSRLELGRKLAPFAENPEDIPGLLDDFERRGWLSERRVVDQVLASRRRRFGAQRIAHELREKGLSEAAIAGAQLQLQESELETARAVWKKKFGVIPANAGDKARQVRFLQGRGFSLDIIRRLLRDVDE
ncbi:MAG: recombination regulator RecX [Pseudomonadota bacterium]